DGKVTPLQDGERVVTTFAAGRSATGAPGTGSATDGIAPRFAFVAETPTQPGELYLREPDGTERRLGAFHDAWAKGLALRAPEGPFDAGGKGVEEAVPFW